MKIGLIDVDSHNFPNLALMKLSAWHKAQGDAVEWWWGFGQYDRVYMSKVFDATYSADQMPRFCVFFMIQQPVYRKSVTYVLKMSVLIILQVSRFLVKAEKPG